MFLSNYIDSKNKKENINGQTEATQQNYGEGKSFHCPKLHTSAKISAANSHPFSLEWNAHAFLIPENAEDTSSIVLREKVDCHMCLAPRVSLLPGHPGTTSLTEETVF